MLRTPKEIDHNAAQLLRRNLLIFCLRRERAKRLAAIIVLRLKPFF
jgi:hypothetical protein